MTEKEQEILDLYVKYLKKKRIIITFIIISVLVIGGLCIKKFIIPNNENTIIEINNVIEKVEINENEKESKEENAVKQTSKSEPQLENPNQKEENTNIKKIETKDESQKQETKHEKTSLKPPNKDFLFTDGYTMDNVTQAAQNYLSSSGYSGECIPIKDDEGVYLGMRVNFY